MEPAKRSKITQVHQDEAAKLRELWTSRKHRTQAQFGEHYGLGSQANVGHYLQARSALNLTAAAAFATELQCRISDFSPRLAQGMEAISRNFLREQQFGNAQPFPDEAHPHTAAPAAAEPDASRKPPSLQRALPVFVDALMAAPNRDQAYALLGVLMKGDSPLMRKTLLALLQSAVTSSTPR
jgi:hypothetical protein